MEREKVEQVCLTWAIYVELLTLWKLIEKEIRIFEEKKNKKLEEELKTTLNFLMKTMILTTTT
jgi:hypothetical protein